MKTLAFLLALGFLTLTAAAQPTLVFEPDTRIWVEGTSTVHDWECQAESFNGALETAAGERLALTDGRLAIAVQGIDCDSGTMNDKMHDALEADDHPAIQFALTDAATGSPDAEGWFDVTAKGELTIAGETQPVTLQARGKALGEDRYRFTGQHTLLMTDYGVDPPTAMLGTLKTGDEVTVHFDATVSAR